MMNEANEISHHTKLYGFIGEEAGQSSLSASVNRIFKANNKDAMMIPMNIRDDDFFFTVSNMKKSHVNGAVISNEFVGKVVEVLDDSSSLVKRSGMCDIVVRDGEKLIGDIFGMRVLLNFLKDNHASKIALIGVNPHAKVFSFLSCGFKVSYFNDDLEELMTFTQETETTNADINRIAPGMKLDFSEYDAVLEFSDMSDFSMVDKLSNLNIDMKHKKQYSALKTRAVQLEDNYTSYDDILNDFAQGAYNFFDKKGHLKYDKSEMKF